MDSKNIKQTLDDLVQAALGKGLSMPSCYIEIKSQSQIWAHVTWKPDENTPQVFHYEYRETAQEALQFIQEKIEEAPSLADAQRNEYLKRLAAAVDYGKKIGMDEDFVNPLILQMKKLSSNIIEHKQDLNDEIPF